MRRRTLRRIALASVVAIFILAGIVPLDGSGIRFGPAGNVAASGIGPATTPGPSPTVTSITPATGPDSATTPVIIRGTNFRTGATVKLEAAGTSRSLIDVTVSLSTLILAVVPAGVPGGTYDVVVTNTDFTTGRLANGYTVLGAIPDPRVLVPTQGTNDIPNDITIDGFNFQSGVSVELAQGGVTRSVLTGTNRIASTRLQATVPDGLAPGTYDVIVRNTGITVTGVMRQAYSNLSPLNLDLFADSSDVWTDPVTVRANEVISLGVNLHRRGGATTISVPVKFYLGDPAAGGTLIGSATSLPMPPRTDLETVAVNWTVGARTGPVTVTVVLDPDNTFAEVTKVNNTVMRQVLILPAAPDTTPPEVVDLQANNGAQITTNSAVTVTLTAVDPPPSSGLASMMLVEREFNASAKAWIEIQRIGWISYTSTYNFNLTNRGGVRYIQTYVADAAGNISLNVVKQRIDYAPPTDTLRANQIRLYRQDLKAGDTLTARLAPISGDADLYVWSPSGNSVIVKANSGLAVDEGSYTVPPGGDGIYQIEIFAYSNTTYRLTTSVTRTPSRAPSGPSITPNEEKTLRSTPLVTAANEPEGRTAVPGAPVTDATTVTPTPTGTVSATPSGTVSPTPSGTVSATPTATGSPSTRVFLPTILKSIAAGSGW